MSHSTLSEANTNPGGQGVQAEKNKVPKKSSQKFNSKRRFKGNIHFINIYVYNRAFKKEFYPNLNFASF